MLYAARLGLRLVLAHRLLDPMVNLPIEQDADFTIGVGMRGLDTWVCV